MNAYLFCFMLNLAAMFSMCLIAWFVWQGASPWLVLIAFFFSLVILAPGRETFTCPECGHTGTLKVFKIGFYSVSLPQAKQGEKDAQ